MGRIQCSNVYHLPAGSLQPISTIPGVLEGKSLALENELQVRKEKAMERARLTQAEATLSPACNPELPVTQIQKILKGPGRS
jgi:hypothetical protein